MSLEWIRENPPAWDTEKERIIGGAPAGVFDFALTIGDPVPGEWWRVEQDGRVVGYGWMDCNFGDAEILLAVDSDHQGGGVGSFILDRLETEAAARGLNYMLNEVRATHPDAEGVTRWLNGRGFSRSHDDRLLRRAVRSGG